MLEIQVKYRDRVTYRDVYSELSNILDCKEYAEDATIDIWKAGKRASLWTVKHYKSSLN